LKAELDNINQKKQEGYDDFWALVMARALLLIA
jgi:hypothetical protein